MAILGEEGIVEVLVVHPPADGLADKRPQHQGRDEGELVGHLKDHEDSCHGGEDNRSETGAHADHAQGHRVSS